MTSDEKSAAGDSSLPEARSWLEIAGPVKGEAADAIADALLEAGALAVDVADLNAESDAEQPIFGEPGMALTQRWADSRIAALFESSVAIEDIEALWNTLRQQSAGGGDMLGLHEFRVVPETDWVRATQAQFEPIEITPTLWIVPTWCEPPSAKAINLRVDPGLAFGTGTHPTTRLCLQWLSELDLQGRAVLDYGCGSGILAMAAAALGASSVYGVDIDPQAIETARLNTQANELQATYAVSDRELNQQFDVVVANILAGPLTVLAPAICAHVRPGGQLALAGILAPQIERIEQAYAPWLTMRVSAERDGWVRMTGQRAG